MGDGKIICLVFVYYFNSWGIKEADNTLIFLEEESG